MPQYLLLLHSDPSGMQKMSPEEMQKSLEKYMAWTTHSVLHKRLGDDVGKVIRSEGGKLRTTDGPYSETKEVLGGFYTVEAPDYNKAVEIAKTHPHLEHGGTVEVRHIFGT